MLELEINDIVLAIWDEEEQGKRTSWKTSGVCISTYSKNYEKKAEREIHIL